MVLRWFDRFSARCDRVALLVLIALVVAGGVKLDLDMGASTFEGGGFRYVVAFLLLLAEGVRRHIRKRMSGPAKVSLAWTAHVIRPRERSRQRVLLLAGRALFAAVAGCGALAVLRWALCGAVSFLPGPVIGAIALCAASLVTLAAWFATDLPFSDAFRFGRGLGYAKQLSICCHHIVLREAMHQLGQEAPKDDLPPVELNAWDEAAASHGLPGAREALATTWETARDAAARRGLREWLDNLISAFQERTRDLDRELAPPSSRGSRGLRSN